MRGERLTRGFTSATYYDSQHQESEKLLTTNTTIPTLYLYSNKDTIIAASLCMPSVGCGVAGPMHFGQALSLMFHTLRSCGIHFELLPYPRIYHSNKEVTYHVAV